MDIDNIIKEINTHYKTDRNIRFGSDEILYSKITLNETQTSDERKLKLRELSLQYSLNEISEDDYIEKEINIDKIKVDDSGIQQLEVKGFSKKVGNNNFSIRLKDISNREEIIIDSIKQHIYDSFRQKVKKVDTLKINLPSELNKTLYEYYSTYRELQMICSLNNMINFRHAPTGMGTYIHSPFLEGNEMLLANIKDNIIFQVNNYIFENDFLYISYILEILEKENCKLLLIE